MNGLSSTTVGSLGTHYQDATTLLFTLNAVFIACSSLELITTLRGFEETYLAKEKRRNSTLYLSERPFHGMNIVIKSAESI
jgi:hypothetical protein